MNQSLENYQPQDPQYVLDDYVREEFPLELDFLGAVQSEKLETKRDAMRFIGRTFTATFPESEYVTRVMDDHEKAVIRGEYCQLVENLLPERKRQLEEALEEAKRMKKEAEERYASALQEVATMAAEVKLGTVEQKLKGSDYDDASLTAEYERSGFYDKLYNTTMRVLSPKDGTKRKGILVFTRFTREAEDLVRRLGRQKVKAASVSADTPQKIRTEIINAFKKGDISVVVNVFVLGKGFDYPELDTIIMARPTKSLTVYYQAVGRLLRPFPNKKPWVIDLSGSYRRFGKVSDLKITTEKPNTELWAVFSKGRKLTNTQIL